jgi:hypothetical protein
MTCQQMKGNFKSLRFNIYFRQEQQSITSPTHRRQFVVYVGRLPQKSTKFQVILIKNVITALRTFSTLMEKLL